jgi:MoxR-like ATPase
VAVTQGQKEIVRLMKNKLFDPPMLFQTENQSSEGVADRRDGQVYVFTEEIVYAVNVAEATGRPILVRGPSGSGKSSLARSVANFKKWRFYERVITSRTQARDLQYEIDLLRRLHDAQAAIRNDIPFNRDFTPYVVPRILWWAFNRQTAARRGAPADYAFPITEAEEPKVDYDHERAVVLLDEIDKADPDVPNNLLVPIGSLQFNVEETMTPVNVDAAKAPLIFITSNDERELPVAFLRRCVELNLPPADRNRLLEIGKAHFATDDQGKATAKDKWVEQLTDALVPESATSLPSVAEYIDVLRACDRLGMDEKSPEWGSVVRITVRKSGASADGG